MASSAHIGRKLGVLLISSALFGVVAIRNDRVADLKPLDVADTMLAPSARSMNAPVVEILPGGVSEPPPPIDDSFLRPVDGEFLSGFGPRADGMHTGIDLRGVTGEPILAAEKGMVTAESCGSGYGTCTMIDHGNGVTTLYAHMSRKVVTGGPVERGQVIGLVGCTGSCETPHVHFEVRQGGVRMNPMGYL